MDTQIGFYSVKTFNIMLYGNVYLLSAVLISQLLDKFVMKPYDKRQTKIRNLLQLMFEVGLICVFVYFIRHFVKHQLPNPMDGLYNFQSSKLVEMNGGVILPLSIFIYLHNDIQSKVFHIFGH